MPTVSFRIGDAFPADDPVARFISVVAMMSNDWLRSMDELLKLEGDDPEEAGRRVSTFRYQASLHHEAASFIADARRRFPEVASFIDGLPQEAQDECDAVLAGIDPQSSEYHGEWVEKNRNVTFHYPEMHPKKAEHGEEEISQALEDAADIESTIEYADDFASVRFRFADQLTVQWLPDAEGDHAKAEAVVAEMREAVLAVSRFAQRTAQAYMEARPEGTFVES